MGSVYRIKKKIKLFYITLLLIFNSCSSQDKKIYKDYNSKEYTISYEQSWQLKIPQKNLVQFFSNKENEKDTFQENFNVIIQDLSGQNMTIDSYSDLTIGQITNAIGKESILEFKDVEVQGTNGKEIIYKMPISSPTGQREELKLKQRWFIKADKAYLLTFTAKKDTYSKYIETAEQMFNSFKLK